jgi:transposase
MTPTLIVVEATGGYERALVATLAAAGLPLVVVNPRLVGHRLTTGSSLRIVAVRFR